MKKRASENILAGNICLLGLEFRPIFFKETRTLKFLLPEAPC